MNYNCSPGLCLLLCIFLAMAACSTGQRGTAAGPAGPAVKQLAPKGKIGKISADELKIMIEDGTRFFLVDNRSEYEYRLGHLPGAVSIMRYRFKDLAALLPGDKQFPIVFYCNGMGCQPSKAAAEAAKTLGYDNIAVFSGGYPEWMKKGYAIEKGK